MTIKLSSEEIKKTSKIKLDYEKANQFLHCKDCLTKFLKSADYKAGLFSPKEYMEYEVSSYPFKYPNGHTANILVVWCKKCGKEVWDSRHLTHIY